MWLGSRRLILGAALASSVGLDAAVPARPVTLTKAAAQRVVVAIQKDRAETNAWLRSDPTSYLATVDRRDFGDKKAMTVGRAADNDVPIDADGVAAHHLLATVDGDRFRVTAIDPEARFAVKDTPLREATLDPSYIRVGRFTLRLSHQRFPAIIVFDPTSPRFKEYKPLQFFDVNLAYRYELPLTANSAPETVIIMSTIGSQRRAQRVGWFDFVVGETAYRLEATRLLEPGVGEHDLTVLFRDATSGHETYALGRYVDPVRLPDGRYLLDFNAAYNPACAFSTHYNCPIPPKSNTLAVAIRAGEMDSDYH